MRTAAPDFVSAVEAGFDASFYKNIYKDVADVYGENANHAPLFHHYLSYGIKEGRVSGKNALKENLSSRLPDRGVSLEIGPFTNPLITGPNVRYFDVHEKAALIERAKRLGRPTSAAVDIDFVDPNGDLAIIDMKFDSIVSSHCIEHQPDVIQHLKNVEKILQPDGAYYLVIPDKRYCFDHFVTETNTIDALVAHEEKRRVHTLQKVVEHRTIVTHNDPRRHWSGDHGRPHYLGHGKAPIENAMSEFRRAEGSYIDVHAWQFTPAGFHKVISELNQRGYIDLCVSEIFPTPRNRLEFLAVLRKQPE